MSIHLKAAFITLGIFGGIGLILAFPILVVPVVVLGFFAIVYYAVLGELDHP